MSIDTDTLEEGKTGSEWDLLDADRAQDIEVLPDGPSPKIIDSASSLSNRLTREIDDRKEERFYWIFAISIVLDIAVLPGLGAVAFFICSMQIIMLIGLANKLGIDIVVQLLRNLLNKLKLD